jgi:hypothetical protein
MHNGTADTPTSTVTQENLSHVLSVAKRVESDCILVRGIETTVLNAGKYTDVSKIIVELALTSLMVVFDVGLNTLANTCVAETLSGKYRAESNITVTKDVDCRSGIAC